MEYPAVVVTGGPLRWIALQYGRAREAANPVMDRDDTKRPENLHRANVLERFTWLTHHRTP